MMILPVTQIGSLPFDNPIDAVKYSRKHPIPFLPELVVARQEFMLRLIKDPGKLSCLDEFTKEHFEQVKLQCIGPMALRRWGNYSVKDAMSMIRTYLDTIFERVNAEQKILFLDEPGLEFSEIGMGQKLWQEIFGVYHATPGIHNCGPIHFEAMFRSGVVEIISFDAFKYKAQAAEVLSRRNGKRIAWGVKSIDDVLDFKPGDLITPPCGLSFKDMTGTSQIPYTAQECESIYGALIDIAQRLSTKP